MYKKNILMIVGVVSSLSMFGAARKELQGARRLLYNKLAEGISDSEVNRELCYAMASQNHIVMRQALRDHPAVDIGSPWSRDRSLLTTAALVGSVPVFITILSHADDGEKGDCARRATLQFIKKNKKLYSEADGLAHSRRYAAAACADRLQRFDAMEQALEKDMAHKQTRRPTSREDVFGLNRGFITITPGIEEDLAPYLARPHSAQAQAAIDDDRKEAHVAEESDC